MERGHKIVFDDFVPTNGVVYSSTAELDQELGRFDQLALFCVLGNVPGASNSTTPAKFYVFLSHSGDGETFVVKNGSSGPPPSNPEVTITYASTSPPTAAVVGWGSDPNTTVDPPTPFLRYVRLNVYMTGFKDRLHARIYATQRDQGG
ncbi:MAG TPA: hypothetical protein VHB21_09475 [Minicystis sp.]|nr:hypothetical protein [Minicystis sp.]